MRHTAQVHASLAGSINILANGCLCSKVAKEVQASLSPVCVTSRPPESHVPSPGSHSGSSSVSCHLLGRHPHTQLPAHSLGEPGLLDLWALSEAKLSLPNCYIVMWLPRLTLCLWIYLGTRTISLPSGQMREIFSEWDGVCGGDGENKGQTPG